MSSEDAATNKELVRQFYKDVYVDWTMSRADQVLSPQFTSHDWPEGGPTGPKAYRVEGGKLLELVRRRSQGILDGYPSGRPPATLCSQLTVRTQGRPVV